MTENGRNCGEMEPLLPDWVEGTLAEEDAARVGAHVAGCARCAAEAEGWRAFAGRLAVHYAAEAPVVPIGLEKRIAAAVRQESVRMAAPAAGVKAGPPVGDWAVALAATAIGLTVALLATLGAGQSIPVPASAPGVMAALERFFVAVSALTDSGVDLMRWAAGRTLQPLSGLVAGLLPATLWALAGLAVVRATRDMVPRRGR